MSELPMPDAGMRPTDAPRHAHVSSTWPDNVTEIGALTTGGGTTGLAESHAVTTGVRGTCAATTGPAHTVVDSPLGPLRLAAARGALTGIAMEAQRHAPRADTLGVRLATPGHDPVLAETAAQLAAYFAGELTAFDLPLGPEGTPFQLGVWAALQEIPYGETISYSELADRVGSPGASRAVGTANGRNPLPIVVPCHRVIAADGSLGGYGGGLARKRRLLDLERGGTDRLF